MTDNSFPSRKMGAKPVHGIQALFLRLQSLVLMGTKPCSCEVEAMFVRGCNNVLNVVIL